MILMLILILILIIESCIFHCVRWRSKFYDSGTLCLGNCLVKIEWLCHVVVLHTPGWKNINAVPNRRPTRKKQKKREMSNKEQADGVKKKKKKRKKERQGRTPRRKERRNKTKLAVVWVYESCSLVTETYQRYAGYSCFHLQGKNSTFDIFVCAIRLHHP